MQTARRVALAGILASVALAVLNIVIGLLSQSTSVFATGVEFAGDVLASTVVLGTGCRGQAPTRTTRGHGRIETLAALLVGALLSAAARHLLELLQSIVRSIPRRG
jgi:divalent metal cation (Fe/Co/Zn/Cd) transporter